MEPMANIENIENVENKTSRLNVVVTAADSELGYETVRQLLERGHKVTGVTFDTQGAAKVRAAGADSVILRLVGVQEIRPVLDRAKPDVVLNLWPQTANTLLHDGQDWRKCARLLPTSTQALVEALKGRADTLLVHASYAFLYGNIQAATEAASITVPANDPMFAAAVRSEKMIADSAVPTCLLRLGYLYGPQSHDLKLYINSFKISRPYYAGPVGKLQPWLHFEDAAAALVLVAESRPKGQIFNVADDNPAAFSDFIDYFALGSGYGRPLHIPLWAEFFSQFIIARQQMELLAQSVSVRSDKIKQALGWKPRYPDYRTGIKALLRTWQASKTR